MEEDFDVTQHGEEWGRMLHRSLKVKRCENGYIVEYTAPSKEQDHSMATLSYRDTTVQKTRVFLTNTDLLEFVEKYFKGEPKP